jgi:hypothetical protein
MRHEVVKDGEPVGLLALPHIDPTRGRRRLDVAYGMTLAEMAVVALPEVQLDRVRVSIGEHVIDRKVWHRVRPHHGATVIIRAVPGDDTLRSVLSVAVLVAAVALGQFYAPAIAGAIVPAGFTATASTLSLVGSLATAGIAIAGSLLLNALVPVRGLSSNEKDTDVYAVSGLQNSSDPGGVIRDILGKHRYAPVYAAPPYTQVVGDDQFVVAAFLFGYGPIKLTNHRLGDTPAENYSDIQMQVREGYPDDDPLTLYPQQVIEDQLSVQLTAGNSATRWTARDVTECEVDITFVQGLLRYDDKGRVQDTSCNIQIFARKLGDADFVLVKDLDFVGHWQKIVRRSYRWTLPERGQYEVKVNRNSADATDTKTIDRSDWSAIRSFRPESPFNFSSAPLAMVAIRIRASNQLNGVLNNYNADASRICKDWDAATQTWIVRETNNPASLFRYVLQGPANAYPKTDDEIDIAKLQDWHEFCTSKGLAYNRVHDFPATRLDTLRDVAAAGRATERDDGVTWSVTIDRPQTTYVSAISPRNSWDFQGSTPQVKFPDGHRVQFFDAANAYQQAERVIPFPGVDPDSVEITEDLSFPGVTDAAQIWKEARRRQYELIYRPHTYKVTQDIESLVLARGDLAALNHDVLDRDQVSARVRSVSGQIVSLDTSMTMEIGRTYAVVLRLPEGTSIRRAVATVAGETSELTVIGDLDGVAAGCLALFGTAIRGPVTDVIVKNIERGDNLTATLTLIDAAPGIDDLIDAEVPPAWDGRIGETVDVSALIPAVPIISSVNWSGGVLSIALEPGSGSAMLPATFVISHRLHGGGSFSTITIEAGQRIAQISGYLSTDSVDVKARSVSSYGVASADTIVIVGDGSLTFTSGPATLSSGTAYLGESASSTTESTVEITIPAACTIDKLAAAATVPPGASETFTYTLRKNGSDTALTCTISGVSDTTSSDISHSVSFASGDKATVKVVVSGSAYSARHDAQVRITT